MHPDSRKAHQHSGNSTYWFLVPRGTGQPHNCKEQDNKHRDVNKGDEEDVCNTRMKSMTSRWSNTTHEEEHDANDDDDDDDEDTAHAILIVDENEGKTDNETQRERERAERNPRRRRRRSRQEEEEEEEDEQVQQDVKPKKKNTCNKQFRSTDSDRNKKPSISSASLIDSRK